MINLWTFEGCPFSEHMISGSRQRPVMTALEGFDVGGAVWLDDEAGDGLNPRCSTGFQHGI